MPYQSKDWKINDIIKEDDLDRIEQGLQEFSEIAEQNSSAISNINNILELSTESTIKNYIDSENLKTFNSIPLIDETFTIEGQVPDSKLVGDKLASLQSSVSSIQNFIGYQETFQNDLNTRLKTIENNQALQSITAAQAVRDEAGVFAANAAASANAAAESAADAQKAAIDAANNSIGGIKKYLYWGPGDILEKTVAETANPSQFWICPGYVSNATTGIYFSIHLGKPIEAKKIKVSNLRVCIRSQQGYVAWGAGGSPDPIQSLIGLQEIVCPEAGVISIRLDYGPKWFIAGQKTKITNNRPCSVTIETIKIEFSDD